MRRIFRLRTAMWVLAVGAALAALLLVVAWWQLPWLLTRVAQAWMEESGLEEGGLRVTEAHADRVALVDLVLGDEGWRIQVDRAEARFSLEELWSRRDAESVVAEGVSIWLEEAWLRGLAASGDGEEEGEGELDLAAAVGLPLQSLELKEGELAVALDGRDIRLRWEGAWKRLDTGGAQARLQLSRGQEELALRGEVGSDGEATVELEGTLPDPLGTVERFLADWRERLGWPDEARLELGPARLSGAGELAGDGKWRWSGELDLGRIAVADPGRELVAEGVRLKAEMGEKGEWQGRLEGRLQRGVYEDFALAEQAIELQAGEARGGGAWQVTAPRPLSWVYDGGEVSGTAEGLDVVLDIEEGLGVEGAARLVDLQAYGLWAEPMEATFGGSLERIEFGVPRMALRDYSSVEVVDGEGVVTLPETGPIEVSFEGEVVEDALSSLLPELATSPLQLLVSVETEDEVMDSKASLKALREDQLLSYGDVLVATGQWSGELEADTLDDGELWRVRLRESLSGAKLTGQGWSASGLGSELSLEIEDLDTGMFDGEELGLGGAIEDLLGRSGVEFSLQANDVTAQTFAAQWLDARLELMASEEEPGSLSATLQGNAGVVEAATETLRQVALKSEARGSLAAFEVEGGMDFMYEGLDGRLSFEHAATQSDRDDLAWDLRGRYSLSPLVFDYSDLLSRRIDALHGLSFSGTLSAEGEYWLEKGAFDASAEVSFAEGSVSQPGSQLSMEGIEASLAMESLLEARTKAEASSVSIGRIQVGDLAAREARLRFDLESLNRLHVRQAVASAFGGELSLQPGTVDLEQLGYKGRLRFERISLQDIAGMISFFNGSMEGAVSGFLPLEIDSGRFQLGEGRLELASGETAVLRYNAKGLLTSEEGAAAEEPSLSDRVLGMLEIEPESMVERSLANFKITRLVVRLFPEEQANTPLQIELAGVGRTEKADLPLNIQVNVNGSLEELYVFLIRLSSLGSASLERGR